MLIASFLAERMDFGWNSHKGLNKQIGIIEIYGRSSS